MLQKQNTTGYKSVGVEKMRVQKVKLTDGCPNGCSFCYEPKKEPFFYPIPAFTGDYIQILDMNFLSNPDALKILKELPKKTYEFVCGVDYRRMTQEIADLMKQKGFIKVRWAWDYGFSQQKNQSGIWKMFKKAGYRSEELSVFMITNYKIPINECEKKLDLLKVWNVKVNDCCYDGGYKLAKPLFWSPEQIKRFRAKCRKHNQLVRFKIDPEY
jgi:hypothetical protein